MNDSDILHRPLGGLRHPAVYVGLWLTFIFATSCKVIRPAEFFGLVSLITGAEPQSMQRFALLWGLSWFVIVKSWHFTEYLILTLLVAWFISRWERRLTLVTIAAAVLFCIAYAATDEWHQTFVPDRYGTALDVIIDSAGVCAAGLILLRRIHRSSQGVAEEQSS